MSTVAEASADVGRQAMSYPPEHHLLSDLRVATLWFDATQSRFIAPVVPEISQPNGAMSAGALFAIADFAAASTAIAAAGEDWAGTLDLTVRMSRPVRRGPVVIDGTILRAGGTLMTVRSDIYDGDGAEAPTERVGMTIGGFRRMKRNPEFNAGPATEPEIGVRREIGGPAAGFSRPLHQELGLVEIVAGVVELPKSSYVTNSFGTINGGTTGIVICAGAESAAGQDYVAVDLDVRYIGQAKAGPVRTECSVIRRRGRHAAVEVMVVDLSQDRRPIASGTVLLLEREAWV